jgi:hypothetical protein
MTLRLYSIRNLLPYEASWWQLRACYSGFKLNPFTTIGAMRPFWSKH